MNDKKEISESQPTVETYANFITYASGTLKPKHD